MLPRQFGDGVLAARGEAGAGGDGAAIGEWPRPRPVFPETGADSDTSSMAASVPVPDRPLRELRGVVERITYQNAENGFTVARLAPERPEAEAEAARGEDRGPSSGTSAK